MEAADKFPVRISESDGHLLLVTPMPGIKPADISIRIAGRSVKIAGRPTGPGQDDNLLIEEWKIGFYYRDVKLNKPVSGSLTNATFGNGILTLAMPKVRSESDCSAVTFKLESIDPARGERIGHKGIGIVAADNSDRKHPAPLPLDVSSMAPCRGLNLSVGTIVSKFILLSVFNLGSIVSRALRRVIPSESSR